MNDILAHAFSSTHSEMFCPIFFTVVLSWVILDAKVASWLLDPDNPVPNFEGLIHTTSRNMVKK